MKIAIIVVMALTGIGTARAGSWSAKDAAGYLDQRAAWWMTWKPAARDHDTFCISCHTALPYALGRAALRTALNEADLSNEERQLLDNVRKRVRLWDAVQPFYNDAQNGVPKSSEARGTEAVLNALILAAYDARAGKLSEDTRRAFDNMWPLQIESGDSKGAWPWLNFRNEPWEAEDSQYWGATLAAVAVGIAPGYRASPGIEDQAAALGAYLNNGQAKQSALNRVYLLWASTALPGVLAPQKQKSIIEEVFSKQQDNGGWSSTSLLSPGWKRHDGTELETRSDAYATGLVTYVLEQAGVPRTRLKGALAWLAEDQDPATGRFPAYSLNKQRDPASDAGRFMSDAATAFSVLALTAGN